MMRGKYIIFEFWKKKNGEWKYSRANKIFLGINTNVYGLFPHMDRHILVYTRNEKYMIYLNTPMAYETLPVTTNFKPNWHHNSPIDFHSRMFRSIQNQEYGYVEHLWNLSDFSHNNCGLQRASKMMSLICSCKNAHSSVTLLQTKALLQQPEMDDNTFNKKI